MGMRSSVGATGEEPRVLKGREMAFLFRELDLWRDLSLISGEQAEEIRALYELRPGQLPLMLLGAGGALVGLGVLSFVAANWADLPRTLRVFIIVGAYILSLATAWGCGERYPRASRAFLLLGGFVYGAGIFLMDQMFHYGGSWTTALGWWIAGLVPAALLFCDNWQLLLIQTLSSLYLLQIDAIRLEAILGYVSPRKASLIALLQPAEAVLLLGVLWAIWVWLRGRRTFNANVFLTLLFVTSRLAYCFIPSTMLGVMICLGLALWLCAQWREGPLSTDLAWWGLLTADLSGLFLARPWVWRRSPLLWLEELASALSGWAPASPGAGLAVAAMVCLTPLFLWQFHRGRVMGGVFFVLLIAQYFFDRILDFMSKGWSFTLIGLAFLGLGLLLERRLCRRKAMRGDEGRDEA